jgi:hypothetical protein
MDETGIHDGAPVVAVAAYVARPVVWRNWTKKWNAAKRPIKVFHATDCANLRGEFEGWSKEQRDSWPAPGSEDTELGVSMEPEVDHGEAEVHTRVQA